MTSWTVSIDDTSSFINYHPHGDGGVGNWTSTGWQPWFSNNGFNRAGGELGTGQSLHVTGFPGASLDFTFYGTEVTLYGDANCSYDVLVDGSLQAFQASSGPMLAHITALAEQTHNVTLVAHASEEALFSFDWADITKPLPGGTTPSSQVIQATDTGFFQYIGNWTQLTDPKGQIPSENNPAPYYEARTSPASVFFAFRGSGVSINGSRNWGSYTYKITLDDVQQTYYNASTMWLMGDALLFYQDGLNASAIHKLDIKPTVGGGFLFWLNSVTIHGGPNITGITSSTSPTSTLPVTTGSGTPSPSPSAQLNSGHASNAGRIAGGVVGGLAGLAIIAALFFFFIRRHRRAPPPEMSFQNNAEVSSEVRDGVVPFTGQSSNVVSEKQTTIQNILSPPPPAGTTTNAISSLVSPIHTLPTAKSTQEEGSGSEAVVDRLITLIADRIERTRPIGGRSELGAGSDLEPPPEYTSSP